MADDFTCVYDFVPPPHAELVAGALRSAGIEAHVLTSHHAGEGPPRARVLVPASLAAEAQDVIRELERDDEIDQHA